MSFRFDYILISHFLLDLQDLSVTPTDDSDPSHLSNNRTCVSTIRFNAVLGNIGANLRDKSSNFEDSEDRSVNSMIDLDDFETTEVPRNDEEEGSITSSPNIHPDVAETPLAGPSRNPDIHA